MLLAIDDISRSRFAPFNIMLSLYIFECINGTQMITIEHNFSTCMFRYGLFGVRKLFKNRYQIIEHFLKIFATITNPYPIGRLFLTLDFKNLSCWTSFVFYEIVKDSIETKFYLNSSFRSLLKTEFSHTDTENWRAEVTAHIPI